MSFREYAEKGWPIPEEFRERRYSCQLHGNGMTGEYPIVRFRDNFDIAGEEGFFEPGMTVCVESFIGSRHGGEGVKLEEQVLITTQGVERLTTYPYEPRLLG